MLPTSRKDLSAMELLEWALETPDFEDQTNLISGAAVPMSIRRMALDLLELERRSPAGTVACKPDLHLQDREES